MLLVWKFVFILSGLLFEATEVAIVENPEPTDDDNEVSVCVWLAFVHAGITR